MITKTTNNRTSVTASIITHNWTPFSLCFDSEIMLLVNNSTESVVPLSVIVAVILSESTDGSRVCVGEPVVSISVILYLCTVEVVEGVVC